MFANQIKIQCLFNLVFIVLNDNQCYVDEVLKLVKFRGPSRLLEFESINNRVLTQIQCIFNLEFIVLIIIINVILVKFQNW